MGRGSDTRIYAPRSESTNLLSSANEDETKYNPTSPEDNDKRAEEKKLKDEYEKQKGEDIKHIKIKPSQGLGSGPTLPTDPGLDDGNKRDDEREIGLQGGPAGSRGHLLDMATGAKSGTGSSMNTGVPIAMAEPMADAWSELLKNDDLERYLRDIEERQNAMKPMPVYQQMTNDILLQLWTEHQDENALHELTERQNEEVNNELGEGADETDEGMELANNNVVQEDMFGPAIPYADQIKYASEPMDAAWSELLKEEPTVHPGENQYKHSYEMPNRDDVHPEWYNWIQEQIDNPAEYEGIADDFQQPDINHLAGATSREDFFERLYDLHNFQVDDARPPFDDIEGEYRNFTDVPFNEDTGFTMSEPMAGAWSELLKRDTPGLMEGRRRREKRREFRPSTGQFKRPPGGQTPDGATMRRFRAHMRGIKGGKKTGLMKPHLSVEMSHRGIATKQPMSKDPQKYRQYMGQQEARKILGNVRTTYSPHARHSARSFTAGPTGGGRLTGLLPGQSGQMAQPSLRPMRQPRMPRMRRPRMPGLTPPPQMAPPMSSVPNMPSMAPPPPPQMMMSDERTVSDLLKSNRHANRTEMLALMRMLIQAQRVKDKMKKAKDNFYDGAVPAHPSPVHQHEDEDEKNDGPTQNLETNSSRLGLDPAGYLSSKRGHMG